jgi:hypothetical protein
MEIGTLVTNGTGRRKPGLNDIYAVPLYVVLFIVQRIFVLKICNSAIYCAENFRCAVYQSLVQRLYLLWSPQIHEFILSIKIGEITRII